ncbi:ABC transporter permease [Temperatibacter marinus]|uniref:ABC transporter permease n=1 Tax=Temperatibacter marinus TaxID=1456591 RepID=A0AA52HAY7_9PROT|nr:ABC transporter permease [Temperatibacter marinus]WND04087.1 ABC transporter permease [Temperatibacter marinus]
MTFFSSLLVALDSLRTNAMRSFLAMLGVIIGVASVVVMVSISNGAQRAVEAQIEQLGSNVLMVRPGNRNTRGRAGGSAVSFSDKDVPDLKERVPGIISASGQLRTSGQIIAGNTNWAASIYGVTNEYFEVRGWTIAEGTSFSGQDLRGKVAILGSETAQQLFGESNPIGQRVRVKKIPFTIIGVMEAKGQTSWGRSNDDVVFVPIATARSRLMGRSDIVTNYVREIDVKAYPDEDMKEIENQIMDFFRERRNIAPGAQDNFRIFNMAEFMRARNETQATFTYLLAGTASIALLVGGIGIMNIMLVSVTERTREIGLRMAIGARERDILSQFLIEAITLTFVGGIFGIGLGAVGTEFVGDLGNWDVQMDMNIVIISIMFSTIVGIVFGLYPAYKASKLNPIDALRFD